MVNLASLNRFVKTFVKFPDALPTINDHVINITFATVDLGNYPVLIRRWKVAGEFRIPNGITLY
jgi:hypothetical protein